MVAFRRWKVFFLTPCQILISKRVRWRLQLSCCRLWLCSSLEGIFSPGEISFMPCRCVTVRLLTHVCAERFHKYRRWIESWRDRKLKVWSERGTNERLKQPRWWEQHYSNMKYINNHSLTTNTKAPVLYKKHCLNQRPTPWPFETEAQYALK